MTRPANPELQKAVFGHIRSHILEFGYPPTTRDLMAYTGRNSSSHMHSVLRKLEADGLITMEAGKSRTIRLVGYEVILLKTEDDCECCSTGHGISSFVPRVLCKLCGHIYRKNDGSPAYCTWPESHFDTASTDFDYRTCNA